MQLVFEVVGPSGQILATARELTAEVDLGEHPLAYVRLRFEVDGVEHRTLASPFFRAEQWAPPPR